MRMSLPVHFVEHAPGKPAEAVGWVAEFDVRTPELEDAPIAIQWDGAWMEKHVYRGWNGFLLAPLMGRAGYHEPRDLVRTAASVPRWVDHTTGPHNFLFDHPLAARKGNPIYARLDERAQDDVRFHDAVEATQAMLETVMICDGKVWQASLGPEIMVTSAKLNAPCRTVDLRFQKHSYLREYSDVALHRTFSALDHETVERVYSQHYPTVRLHPKPPVLHDTEHWYPQLMREMASTESLRSACLHMLKLTMDLPMGGLGRDVVAAHRLAADEPAFMKAGFEEMLATAEALLHGLPEEAPEWDRTSWTAAIETHRAISPGPIDLEDFSMSVPAP